MAKEGEFQNPRIPPRLKLTLVIFKGRFTREQKKGKKRKEKKRKRKEVGEKKGVG